MCKSDKDMSPYSQRPLRRHEEVMGKGDVKASQQVYERCGHGPADKSPDRKNADREDAGTGHDEENGARH